MNTYMKMELIQQKKKKHARLEYSIRFFEV